MVSSAWNSIVSSCGDFGDLPGMKEKGEAESIRINAYLF